MKHYVNIKNGKYCIVEITNVSDYPTLESDADYWKSKVGEIVEENVDFRTELQHIVHSMGKTGINHHELLAAIPIKSTEGIEVPNRSDKEIIDLMTGRNQEKKYSRKEVSEIIYLYVASNTYFEVKYKMSVPDYINQFLNDNLK